ncbi:unnamed protein product [Effrenium voratum]|nr:unnamed protein product [Effrenium voratum]
MRGSLAPPPASDAYAKMLRSKVAADCARRGSLVSAYLPSGKYAAKMMKQFQRLGGSLVSVQPQPGSEEHAAKRMSEFQKMVEGNPEALQRYIAEARSLWWPEAPEPEPEPDQDTSAAVHASKRCYLGKDTAHRVQVSL